MSLGIFKYSVGLKQSGPISEVDSPSGRTPADILMSAPLLTHTLLVLGRTFRCIAGVMS